MLGVDDEEIGEPLNTVMPLLQDTKAVRFCWKPTVQNDVLSAVIFCIRLYVAAAAEADREFFTFPAPAPSKNTPAVPVLEVVRPVLNGAPRRPLLPAPV